MAEDRLNLLRDLVSREPEDALTRFLLGQEASSRGLFEEASAAFASAVERDPDYSAAYRYWGNCLEKLGRYHEAAHAYARGVRVAERTGDLQAGKEMGAFLKRLARDRGVSPDEQAPTGP